MLRYLIFYRERPSCADPAEGGRHRVREEEREGRRTHGGAQGVSHFLQIMLQGVPDNMTPPAPLGPCRGSYMSSGARCCLS